MVLVADRPLDELGLSTFAMRRDDQPASHLVCDSRSKIATDDVQAQIDSGRASGRRQDLILIDVKHIRLDPHARVFLGNLLGITPMVRGPSPFQQPVRGKNDDPTPDPYHPPPPPSPP